MQAEILNAGAGHLLQQGDVQMVVKEDGTHIRGTLGLADFTVAPQSQDTPPPHIHHATAGNRLPGPKRSGSDLQELPMRMTHTMPSTISR